MELAQLKDQRKEERHEPEETKFYADGNRNRKLHKTIYAHNLS